MSLSNVIRDNATALVACETGNWPAAVAALEADTTQREDHTLRTTRWLMTELNLQADGQPSGTTEADVVLATLQASTQPRVMAAYQAMSANGIDLADPQVQQMVPLISSGWPSGLEQKVLDAGVKTMSVAEFETGEAPDVVNVEAAYQQIMVEDLEADVATGLNEKVNPAIATGDRAATAAALRQVADDVEVG